MSIFPKTILSALAAVSIAAPLLVSAQSITNASFETGTFNDAIAVAFASGRGINMSTAMPTGWNHEAPADGTPDAADLDYWVNSAQARTGSKYMYITSQGTTEASTDACLRNVNANSVTLSGLNGSVAATSVLSVSIWAANGQTSASEFHMELSQYTNTGAQVNPVTTQSGTTASGNLRYATFVLGTNANGWLPTNTAVVGGIPWTQYTFNFNLANTTRRADIWFSPTDVTATAGVQASRVVFDDAAVTVIPEPSTKGLALVAIGGLLYTFAIRKKSPSAAR